MTRVHCLLFSPHIREMSRCYVCKKKLSLGMNFTCKCLRVFCITHLPIEEHTCSYDHKEDLKKELEKNLIVEGGLKDKMERL